MEKTLVQRLRPWISVFSAEMVKKNKHGDNVKVGGTILSILDFSSCDLKIDRDDIETYITIDDSIGTTDLFFLKDTYHTFNKDYNFIPGMIILAEGKVLREKKVPLDDKKLNTNSIICWDIKPIENVEESI